MDVISSLDYADHLAALLPVGPAWPVEAGSDTAILLDGMSQEFARLDGRISQLVEEADPRTTTELLPDWERVCGLPTQCMFGISQTIDQRRSSVVARLTDVGGQRPMDYIALAATIGFEISITEFKPWDFTHTLTTPFCGLDWAWTWQVNAPLITRNYWSVLNQFTDPLSWWGNKQLECLVLSKSPAHTIVIFSYT